MNGSPVYLKRIADREVIMCEISRESLGPVTIKKLACLFKL